MQREKGMTSIVDIEKIKKMLETQTEENGALTQQIVNLKKHYQEKHDRETDALRTSFEKQNLDLVRNIHGMEDEVEKLKILLIEKDQRLAELKHLEHRKESSQDVEVLQKKLYEKELHIQNFDREVALIKQSLMRALRETKELEVNYENVVKEKSAACQKFQQAHFQIEKLQEEIQQIHSQRKISLEAQKNFQDKFEQVQAAAARLEQSQVTKQQEIHDLERQLSVSQQELRIVREEMGRLKGSLKDKESELLQAQQHLGKKVKEISQIEDKNEALKKTVAELEQWQHQSLIKMAELQTSVDLHSQQQKKIEEKLQEAARQGEAQLAKFEEKYFALYEKWQAAETRNKELEKVEEKQKHLRGVLSNFFTQEAPKENPSSTLFTEEKPSKSFPNLFDPPKPPPKMRQNLLE